MEISKNIRSIVKTNWESLTQDGFHKIFNRIDQLGIKQGVDKMGIEGFITHCARLAAGTGAIAGSGGALTMAIGIPVDLLNMITQQFRVTLGIIYHSRGSFKIDFDEFMTIVATSLQVEAGVAITKTMMERIAERIIMRMGSKTAGRLIPIVGGVIGGTANYLFIKRVGESVKKMQPQYAPLTIHID